MKVVAIAAIVVTAAAANADCNTAVSMVPGGLNSICYDLCTAGYMQDFDDSGCSYQHFKESGYKPIVDPCFTTYVYSNITVKDLDREEPSEPSLAKPVRTETPALCQTRCQENEECGFWAWSTRHFGPTTQRNMCFLLREKDVIDAIALKLIHPATNNEAVCEKTIFDICKYQRSDCLVCGGTTRCGIDSMRHVSGWRNCGPTRPDHCAPFDSMSPPSTTTHTTIRTTPTTKSLTTAKTTRKTARSTTAPTLSKTTNTATKSATTPTATATTATTTGTTAPTTTTAATTATSTPKTNPTPTTTPRTIVATETTTTTTTPARTTTTNATTQTRTATTDPTATTTTTTNARSTDATMSTTIATRTPEASSASTFPTETDSNTLHSSTTTTPASSTSRIFTAVPTASVTSTFTTSDTDDMPQTSAVLQTSIVDPAASMRPECPCSGGADPCACKGVQVRVADRPQRLSLDLEY